MKKLFACFIIFLAIAIKSNGQNSFVLEGTVGKYPIVMLLNEYDDNVSVRYFYKKFRNDIELDGKIISLKIVADKKGWDTKTKTDALIEQFTLQKSANGTWTGEWKDAKGTTLSVNLKMIDTSQYDFSKIPLSDFDNAAARVYTKARLAGLSFVNDSITRSGKYFLQWVHEPVSHIPSFNIIKGFGDEQLNRINAALHAQHLSIIDNKFSCSGRHGEDGDYEYGINGFYLSDNFISVRASVFWICGGAHPGNGKEDFTIDTHTGKILELDDICWFTGKKPLQEKDDRWTDYVDKNGKAICKLLSDLYPNEMKKPKLASNDDYTCDYSSSAVWEFPSWHFTEKGLYLGATFPHVTHACDAPEFSIIPYAVLKPYLTKEFKYLVP